MLFAPTLKPALLPLSRLFESDFDWEYGMYVLSGFPELFY